MKQARWADGGGVIGFVARWADGGGHRLDSKQNAMMGSGENHIIIINYTKTERRRRKFLVFNHYKSYFSKGNSL